MRSSVFLIFFILLACGQQPAGEQVFYNGTVLTMQAPGTHSGNAGQAEAVLVRDGRIAMLGSRTKIFAAKSEAARLIDLQGATLVPGFIAVHTHPDLSAYLHSFVDMSGFTHRTPTEVWQALRDAVAAAEPGAWILCRGFDPILVPGLTSPDIQMLDRLAPENPVFILSQNMHAAWANSAAFRELGITADTPDPAPGSFYESDDEGRLTGFIAETAAIQPFSKAALASIDIKQNIIAVLRDYARQGITTIVTAGSFAPDWKPLMLFEHLSSERAGWFLRLLASVGVLPERFATVRHFVYLQPNNAEYLPDSPDNGDDFYRILGIKVWYDGSPYVASMFLDEAYMNSPLMQSGLGVQPGSTGEAKYSRVEFLKLVESYHRDGWQLAVHAQGDRATRDVLDFFDTMLKKYPRPDHRHRLEHGLLTPKASLDKMHSLGLTPSFHINHLYYYGEALANQIIGARRAEVMLPLASAERAQLKFSLHADQPMYPEDPISMLATAVQRRTRDGGQILGASEKISVERALRALTVDAAYQLHFEDKLGTIEVGKYADFVVLDKNPLELAPHELRTIQVRATYVAGRKIYE